ncbi:MAG: Stp1/IreP family PP2C-type Ser/Thr phosphatase [Cyanothece sp. SIO2G6]|nr:Stp1/IreP family PP2C-type Ser/Thr phosphatase [Cyanothece sp. SIO2G6]
MKRLFTGLTDPGLVRTANQDSYYTDQSGRFFIVADGMGGHAGGQEASRIATDVIRNCLEHDWTSTRDSKDLLEDAVLKANLAIIEDQSSHPERADMGTTVLVVIFRDDQPMCAHIGDSRLYRLRGSRLDQITEDHTWVARAMRLGDLSPSQARVHPWRHVLSKCLGREDLKYVDVQTFDWQPNDRLLLCSDGLTEELSDHLISNHMKTIRSCDKAASALIDAAKDSGGRDNITVIVVATDS